MVSSAAVRALLGGDYHYAIGPLAALAAIAVLVPVLRWMHAPARRARRPDYGLLVAVARATPAQAEQARAALAGAGIRCTLAPAADGGEEPVQVTASGHLLPRPPARTVAVLVFPDDLGAARALLDAAG